MTFSRLARNEVVQRLDAAGCVAANEEAAELCDGARDSAMLEAWTRRREAGEPLAWITGVSRFCGHRLRVERGVYVPRYQTETLARRAAALLAPGGAAVDLCTGAGAIAAHLRAAVPTATIVGVDSDWRAAECARRNMVPVIVGDLGRGLRPHAFDVVTAVAPYVPTAQLRLLPRDVQRYEPRLALDGGDDGLRVVRRVIDAAAHLLRAAGWLLIEIGGGQDRELQEALARHGFGAATTWTDENGDLRGLATQLPS